MPVINNNLVMICLFVCLFVLVSLEGLDLILNQDIHNIGRFPVVVIFKWI